MIPVVYRVTLAQTEIRCRMHTDWRQLVESRGPVMVFFAATSAVESIRLFFHPRCRTNGERTDFGFNWHRWDCNRMDFLIEQRVSESRAGGKIESVDNCAVQQLAVPRKTSVRRAMQTELRAGSDNAVYNERLMMANWQRL